MDFNITGSQVKPTENMDFNITGSQANVTEHMDFDVTGSHPNVTEHTDFDVTGGHPEMSEGLHMDFDVTSSHPAVTEAAGAHEDQTTMMLSGGSMDFEATMPRSPEPEDSSSVLESDILQFDVSSGAYAPARDIDLGGINLDLGQEVTTLVSPVAEAKQDEKWHEVATKLDLAKAYQEMGDADGAREILGEVIRDGDDDQQEAAQALMQQL
jgi:pilus assembly protein FimV